MGGPPAGWQCVAGGPFVVGGRATWSRTGCWGGGITWPWGRPPRRGR